MRYLIILVLVVIVASLASAMFFLIRDHGQTDRTVKALTVRISLSIILISLIGLGLWLGVLPPK